MTAIAALNPLSLLPKLSMTPLSDLEALVWPWQAFTAALSDTTTQLIRAAHRLPFHARDIDIERSIAQPLAPIRCKAFAPTLAVASFPNAHRACFRVAGPLLLFTAFHSYSATQPHTNSVAYQLCKLLHGAHGRCCQGPALPPALVHVAAADQDEG
jgi:hypothetical protein